MKHLILCFLLLSFFWISCKKNDVNQPEIAPVDLNVKANYAIQMNGSSLPLTSIVITATNVNTNSVVKANISDKGVLTFKSLPTGTYDIDAVARIEPAAYNSITGSAVTDSVVFNASQKNLVIAAGADTVNLSLVAGKLGDWVIKQIYYAGSNIADGATFRDQFVEVYNNSDKTLYADSLVLATLWSRRSFTTETYELPNRQYDWNKAVGMPAGIDANNNYVYAEILLRIPGRGTDYPVGPGKSIIIAQTAVNHKSPFTGVDGKTISVRNPDLTIDLSGAEFETYYAPLIAKPLASDIDNLNSVNVQVLKFSGGDWIQDNNGRDSYAIYKAGAVATENLPEYPIPSVSAPSASAKKYTQIPISLIIDAVEVQPNVAEDRIPKSLGSSLDAGYTYVPKGRYSSQSVIRKTAKNENGIIKLLDTNNSTEDFTYFDIAIPKGFK